MPFRQNDEGHVVYEFDLGIVEQYGEDEKWAGSWKQRPEHLIHALLSDLGESWDKSAEDLIPVRHIDGIAYNSKLLFRTIYQTEDHRVY